MMTTSYYGLVGGLDLVTPPIEIPPGRAVAGLNYELASRGYRRSDGFERFDGRPKPSEASYWVLNFDQGSAEISEGDTVTGDNSGATGIALVDAVIESGSYGGGDAAGYLVLTAVSGTFQDDENLQVSMVTKSVADGLATERGALTDANDATWLQDAIETARGNIQKVPGSGALRGAWVYKGDIYAFRDNAGATAVVMHKATTSGWSAVSLGLELDFTSGGLVELDFTSGGTTEVMPNDVIVGATSGATATVVSVTLDSGTWAGGDAAGTFVITNKVGVFEAEDLDIQGGGSNVATIAGDSTLVKRIDEGDTITGGTSAATATVERVITQTGSWTAGTAAGYLILSGQTGTFQAEELDIGSNAGVATIAGDSSAITLPAGGRYEFRNHNFFGASDLRRMYGVNGVGKGFEFDGTVFVPIRTGMAADAPKHLMTHKEHLFYVFAGGSVQHSAIGDPYAWQVVLGAAEIALGVEVTAMIEDVSGVAAIFGRQKVAILYGSSAADWDLDVLGNDIGGVEWTVQKIGNPIYLDNRGLRDLSQTQKFGNFVLGTITRMVEPIFSTKRKAGTTAVASVRVRSKDQYRLFWSDGTGMTVYFGHKAPEILEFDLGKTVRTICSADEEDGDEVLFFGSDDGYLYQLDAGTSFDGSQVDAYIRLPFNHVGSPNRYKRWFQAILEVDSDPSAQLGVIAEFTYADPNQIPTQQENVTAQGGGGLWDEVNWDDFYWSSPIHGLVEVPIDGLGQNISLTVISQATYEKPHTIHGVTLGYMYRGAKRLR